MVESSIQRTRSIQRSATSSMTIKGQLFFFRCSLRSAATCSLVLCSINPSSTFSVSLWLDALDMLGFILIIAARGVTATASSCAATISSEPSSGIISSGPSFGNVSKVFARLVTARSLIGGLGISFTDAASVATRICCCSLRLNADCLLARLVAFLGSTMMGSSSEAFWKLSSSVAPALCTVSKSSWNWVVSAMPLRRLCCSIAAWSLFIFRISTATLGFLSSCQRPTTRCSTTSGMRHAPTMASSRIVCTASTSSPASLARYMMPTLQQRCILICTPARCGSRISVSSAVSSTGKASAFRRRALYVPVSCVGLPLAPMGCMVR
mmetsp:Transcript_5632/g.9727  ORF Transcript_5632/g.9727 Transcript_5632/m.9727 type:complete len:324 (-) Transcript_5632:745-1716(-)